MVKEVFKLGWTPMDILLHEHNSSRYK